MKSILVQRLILGAFLALLVPATARAIDTTSCLHIYSIATGNSFENVRVKAKASGSNYTFSDSTNCSATDSEAVTVPEANQFKVNSSLLLSALVEDSSVILALDGCAASRRKIVGVQVFSGPDCK